MHQYDELRGYETKDLWGSFHSHFTELWLEQTVLIWMVCPTNGLQSFITQGMPVDLVPRTFAQVSTNDFLLKSMETCRRYKSLVTPDALTYLLDRGRGNVQSVFKELRIARFALSCHPVDWGRPYKTSYVIIVLLRFSKVGPVGPSIVCQKI